MKRLILGALLLIFATSIFAQERIKPIKIDTTRIDSSGVIKQFTVDYEFTPIQKVDTLEQVVLDIDQIEMNVVYYTELYKVQNRLLKSLEAEFESTQLEQIKAYLKKYHDAVRSERDQVYVSGLEELEKRKAFKKLIK